MGFAGHGCGQNMLVWPPGSARGVPMKLQMKRTIDIEITNRCNATCSFCPRDKTPKQGFMSFETFQQAVHRFQEFDGEKQVSLTGLGEPMLHPRFIDCIRYLSEQGIDPQFTTNASRLTREKSLQLLDAGLKTVVFSVSDLHEDYRNIYNLDFQVTRQNILDFIDVNQGRCHVQLTVVRHSGNLETADAVREYWENTPGINVVQVIKEMNRGGSLEKPFRFQGNTRHTREALQALGERGMTSLCSLPFVSVFIGWDGSYYLCCMDWEKTVSLGTVHELSIRELDQRKLDFIALANPLCDACSTNPVNEVREAMFAVEHGERGKFGVIKKLNMMERSHHGTFSRALACSGYQSAIIASSRG